MKFLLHFSVNNLYFQGGQLIQLGVCKPGSAKLDTVELGETISNVFKQVKSWVDKRNPDFREEIYNCLGKELRFAVKLLLCEGEQSRENIAVIRQQFLDPFCSGTESFFCRFAMYLTEPETVEMMIPVMKNTSLCQETAGKRRSREINLNVGYRKKRQYDLRTLYDIYSRIFCSPRQDLVAVFDGNDPETFEGMTDGMKLFIVYMRFRGSVCCIADLSNFGYGPGTF